jgi:hypothetical protein
MTEKSDRDPAAKLKGSNESSEAPTLPPRATPPLAPIPRQLPALPTAPTSGAESLDDDYWQEKTLPTTGIASRKVAAARTSVTAPIRSRADERPSGWANKLLGPLLVGWQERRYAAKTSLELLKLYRKVAAGRPGLRREDLYRRVVLARLGGATEASADAILDRATESFATWPAERPLTFRDVVHYLAVSEYLASHNDAAAWTQENMGRVVAKLVPDDL